MAERHMEVAVAAFDADGAKIKVEEAFEKTKAFCSKLGVNYLPSKPDFAKIRKAMAATKKPMCFRATFDGKWIQVDGMVGTTVVDKNAMQDLSDGGNQKLWRSNLEALIKNAGGKLFNAADLKEFDKKHADPDMAERLQKAIAEQERQIKLKALDLRNAAMTLKGAQDALKKVQDEVTQAQTKLHTLQKALKDLGG